MGRYRHLLPMAFIVFFGFQPLAVAENGCADVSVRVEGVAGKGGAISSVLREEPLAWENSKKDACSNAKNAVSEKAKAMPCPKDCVLKETRGPACDFRDPLSSNGEYPTKTESHGDDPNGGTQWHEACILSEYAQGRFGPTAQANCASMYAATYSGWAVATTKANGSATNICIPGAGGPSNVMVEVGGMVESAPGAN